MSAVTGCDGAGRPGDAPPREAGAPPGPRIVHVSSYDVAGGAALAAIRLHREMVRQGRLSTMVVAQRYGGDDPAVTPFAPPMAPAVRLRRRLRREIIARDFARHRASRPAGYERFTDDRCEHGGTLPAGLPPAEIVHLHWVSGLVDYGAVLPAVAAKAGLVWTLHDMNAFTGGCHYDMGCGRHGEGCGACPQLGSRDPNDLSRRVFLRKRDAFDCVAPDRLRIVAMSRWMAGLAQKSPLLSRFPVTVIPNGLDLDVFTPRDRAFARDALGIPRDARVVLFAAESADNRRKGFAFLAQALSGLRDPAALCLVSLGRSEPRIEASVRHVHLGYIDRDRLLSLAYSAADVFAVPSLQDNAPNTVMEALACGTPVVGFAVGGIPEMVRSGVTGLLVPSEDVEALRHAIETLLLDGNDRCATAARCRESALSGFSIADQARRYTALYEELAPRARRGAPC